MDFSESSSWASPALVDILVILKLLLKYFIIGVSILRIIIKNAAPKTYVSVILILKVFSHTTHYYID